jgi:hypothetical protein
LDRLGQRLVRASYLSVVAFHGVVGQNVKTLAHYKFDIFAVLVVTRTDLWAFGVKHDSADFVGPHL